MTTNGVRRSDSISTIASYGNRVEGWVYWKNDLAQDDRQWIKLYGVVTGQFILMYQNNTHKEGFLFQIAISAFDVVDSNIRIVDPFHSEISIHLYHKEEFAEWIEKLEQAVALNQQKFSNTDPESLPANSKYRGTLDHFRKKAARKHPARQKFKDMMRRVIKRPKRNQLVVA